jgi:hypothetical protein
MGFVVREGTEAEMKRTLTPEMMNALLDPNLKLDKDGKFSFVIPGDKTRKESREDTALTVKMASEAIRFLDLLGRSDPRSPQAKQRLQEWLDAKPKNTSSTIAPKAKWNDPATRLLAVWNNINDRRTVLVDTSLLFNEGGRAFPLGAVDVRYEKTAATKTQPEAERIVITRASNPTKEETANHEEKKKKQREAKDRKKKK